MWNMTTRTATSTAPNTFPPAPPSSWPDRNLCEAIRLDSISPPFFAADMEEEEEQEEQEIEEEQGDNVVYLW